LAKFSSKILPVIVIFTLLFLLLFYLKFSDKIDLTMLEGGGGGGEVAVNFGDSEVGMGDNFTSVETVTSAAQQHPDVSTEKEIVVSENDDAPAIVNAKKPTTKPKKEIVVIKPVKIVTPKPSKTTSDALANLLNGSNSGDGEDKQGGNKGKAGGDKNATGYNGGGGSGTGSGGGNGSGQGIGSGSGYGSGSGSGKGSGVGNYQLSGRKVLSKPQPKYTCNEQGTVAVEITVNSSGIVTNATPGVRGTTNAAKCLLDQAKIAAENTKFDASENAPDKQVGKIIYSFKLTE
jgi:outer membrane biosynthesis protein TonB